MDSKTTIGMTVFFLIGALVLQGCGSSGSESDWERVNREELTSGEKQLLQRAKKAQGDLAKTLLGRVTEVIKKENPAQAVEVCNLEAQGLTEKVAEEHDVRIGRTSFKLRNPENTPPNWAQSLDLVEKRVEDEVVLSRTNGKGLAVFSPIRLAEKCTACHGSKDQLAPGVEEELAKRYPEDEATGFEAGDLRGWFWVEVDSS